MLGGWNLKSRAEFSSALNNTNLSDIPVGCVYLERQYCESLGLPETMWIFISMKEQYDAFQFAFSITGSFRPFKIRRLQSGSWQPWITVVE